jgi:hypothetical protein
MKPDDVASNPGVFNFALIAVAVLQTRRVVPGFCRDLPGACFLILPS